MWNKILFTDESRFSLQDFYLEQCGTRNQPSNISELNLQLIRDILMWMGITINSHTDHHIFERDILNRYYRNEILELYVLQFSDAVDPGFTLVANNAC